MVGDFGRAEDGRDIAREIVSRMGPSLAIALPTFVLGLFVTVCMALLLAFFRATAFDFWGVVLCVAMMFARPMHENALFFHRLDQRNQCRNVVGLCLADVLKRFPRDHRPHAIVGEQFSQQGAGRLWAELSGSEHPHRQPAPAAWLVYPGPECR